MDYGKKGLERKREHLLKTGLKRRRIGTTIAKILFIFFLFCVAGLTYVGVRFVQGVIADAPDVSDINASPTGFMTTVLDRNGDVTAELVESGSNRVYASLDEIPLDLQHAFVAIEDSRFYDHNGIDTQGIARAALRGISRGRLSEGASTLTQQLLKNNVFEGWTSESNEQKLKRKLQEQYLAVQLEKQVSKDWIMENYLNTINLGQNTLGVQAASRRYFGKDVSELNLSECAVLAAITKNPGKYNPLTNPSENQKRREKVLEDMMEQGYISQEQCDAALQDNVYARIQENNHSYQDGGRYITTYFVDELTQQVISDLQTELGYSEQQAYKAVYSGGLTIYSTQDPHIQKTCDAEVNDSANYSGKTKISFDYRLSITREDGTVEHYSHQTMQRYYKQKTGDEEYSINYRSEEEAQKYIDEYRDAMLQKGGTVLAESIVFLQEPQASVTVMDQKTGQVLALVGGRGEKNGSKTLNRASDTTRQPGSTFKPLAVYAAALDTGNYTLATNVLDEPYNYENGRAVNNYERSYDGWLSIREAIVRSKNIIAVKTLTDITPKLGYDYLERFGITTLDAENDIYQPLALGGIYRGVTNLELTGAYAAIANQGTYTEPILYTKVVDQDGKVLLEKKSETREVIADSTAFLLTSAMQDVVARGTGKIVSFPDMSIAGKTGTTSDNRDTWFAGYTPYYTCVVWGGNDDNAVLDNTRFSRTIWKGIMSRIHEGKADPGFEVPESVQETVICTESGQLAIPGVCTSTETEYFSKETEPEEYCQVHGGGVQPGTEDGADLPDGAVEDGDAESDGTKHPGQNGQNSKTESDVLSGSVSGH